MRSSGPHLMPSSVLLRGLLPGDRLDGGVVRGKASTTGAGEDVRLPGAASLEGLLGLASLASRLGLASRPEPPSDPTPSFGDGGRAEISKDGSLKRRSCGETTRALVALG